MDSPVNSPTFWDDRYDRKEDGWELGAPAPPLFRLLHTAPPSPGKVAIPGCGRGHDVELFQRLGYHAVGFDFSDRAVGEATRLGRFVLKRDIFLLEDEWTGFFDIAWEYTCFCAIDPARRADYVDVLARILRPGGELIALFFPLKEVAPGPPFRVDRDETEKLLRRHFDIESSEVPSDSPERRRGFELLVRARRRS